MPRKSLPLDRTTGLVRDSSIVVIACEDTHAVKQYFAKFRTRRVQFKVLPTEEGYSSPKAVVERLNRYRMEEQIGDEDELWICIDADHWIRGSHQRELAEVLRQCRSNGYCVAISNPCFEVWLLLHFVTIDDELLNTILGNAQNSTVSESDRQSIRCDGFEEHLRIVSGGYNKTNVGRLPITTLEVIQAMQRARELDNGTGDIPGAPGTRAYKLLDTLKRRDFIVLE
jgi:hypothetical protein